MTMLTPEQREKALTPALTPALKAGVRRLAERAAGDPRVVESAAPPLAPAPVED